MEQLSSEQGAVNTLDDNESKSASESLTCKVCGKVYKKRGSFEKHLTIHASSKNLHDASSKNLHGIDKNKSNGQARNKRTCSKDKGDEEDLVALKTNSKSKRLLRQKKKTDTKRGKAIKMPKGFDDSDSGGLSHDEVNGDCESETVEEKGLGNVDEKSNDLECEICYKRFARPESLTVHMYVHKGEKPFPCNLCSKSFARRYHLKVHIRRHSSPNKYACEECGESFKRQDHLKYHKINNHEGTIFLNELKIFNKTGKTNLEKTVLCEICGKGFVDQNRLKVHKKIHTENKRFQCEFCHKSFSNSSNFNVHVRLHTGKNPYKCVVCGECFRTSSRLKTHTRKHTGEYPFVCQVCGKLCGEKHLLKMHLQTHNNEKMYECSHCGKAFAHNSTLRSHIRLHTGSKPYVCQVCGHSFAQVSSLNYHKRTHTGEKPFTCHICGNSYTRKTTLNTHLLRHSGTKLVSCSHCEFTCYTSKQRKKHLSIVHNISPGGGVKPAGKKEINENSDAHNVEQTFEENKGIDPKSIVLPSSTFSPLTSTSMGDEMGFNRSSSSANVPPFTSFSAGIDIVSMKNTDLPLYFNPAQDFLNPPDNPQPGPQFSNNNPMSHHAAANPGGYNPSPVGEATLHNLSSPSTYETNASHNFCFPPNTTYTGTGNPNDSPIINSNGIFSPKPSSFSPCSYFEPVHLPNNCGQNLTVYSQTPSQFPSASNVLTLHGGRNFESAGQKSSENAKNNIWDTIGTSSLVSQNHHVSSEDSQLDERRFTSLPPKSPDKSVENDDSIPKDLVHKAMVSANIGHQDTCLVPSYTDEKVNDDNDMRQNVHDEKISYDNQDACPKSIVPESSSNSKGLEEEMENNAIVCQEDAQPLSPEDLCESDNGNFTEIVENESNFQSTTVDVKDNEDNKQKDNQTVVNKRTKHHTSLRVKLKKFNADSDFKRKLRSDHKAKTKKDSLKRTARVTKVPNNLSLKSKKSGEGKEEKKIKAKNLATHNKHVYKKEKQFHCDDCDIDFSRADHLSKHLTTHRKPQRLTCLYCLQVFQKKEAIVEHIQKEHQGRNPFSCNVCNFPCADVMDLKHHVKLEHDDIEYKCDICDETFPKSKHLKEHMMKSHEQCKAFTCHTCKKSFAESSLLVLHNKHKHSGVKPYKCNLCSKVFAAAAKLQSHLRAHTGDKPYTCEFCGKVFAHLSLLSIHVKAHSSVKPFVCDYCSQSFTHKSTLTAHVRTHTGAKPFECGVCGKSFAQLSSLNYHKKSHDGLKPFTCELCGKSFTRSTTLKTHLMQHDGKKRFSCELCDFKCNRKNALRKHHNKKHSGDDSEEKVTSMTKTNDTADLTAASSSSQLHIQRSLSHPDECQQRLENVLNDPPQMRLLTPYLLSVPASPPLPPQPVKLKHQEHQPKLVQDPVPVTVKSAEGMKEVFSSQSQMPGFFYHQSHHEQQQLHHHVQTGAPPPPPAPMTMAMLNQTAAPVHSFQITLQNLQHYHQPS